MRNFLWLFILLASNFPAFCGDGVWTKHVALEDVIYNVSYGISEPTAQIGGDQRDYEKYYGMVYLDYTRKSHSDVEFTGESWYIDMTIQYIENSITQTEVLHIASDELNGEFVYTDYIKIATLDNIDNYSIEVKSITGAYESGGSMVVVNDPQNNINFPIDIDLRLDLHLEHWYNLDQDAQSGGVDLNVIDFDATNFRAHWSFVEGAEEYDFEWVWIDVESAENALILNLAGVAYDYEVPFKLKEPSRVRTWQTHHVLDNTYAQGTLYFRVRPVSKYLASSNGGVIEQIKLGEWSYFRSLSGFNAANGTYNVSDVTKHYVSSSTDFESNKNWTYSVAYAEDGKNVSSVTFYDGSQRGRQSLSYNSSDNVTLIGETKYDFEGRQTISVIPAPIQGRELGYRSRFNLVDDGGGTSVILDDEHLDQETYTSPMNLPLDKEDSQNTTETIGAAQYFSDENKFTDDLFRDGIPDAFGYVYSQTIYRNDGSGRIEQVGGIGHEFQVGGDHAVRTFYGTPSPVELIRLFGDNVPEDLDGYRKEMVRDANGQYSVTYYNKRGQVIATALAGDAPSNLLELSNAGEQEYTTNLLSNNGPAPGDPYSLISEHTFLNTVPNNDITMFYDLNGDVNTILGGTINLEGVSFALQDLCATCRYDLEITVLDQNGSPLSGFPHMVDVDPATDCFNAVDGSNEGSPDIAEYTHTFSLTFVELGEYRIIKKLSVDQESMQESFQEQLELSGVASPQDFIDAYTAVLDYSGCYYSCDDYCEAFLEFEYDSENGEGSWSSLDPGVQASMIANCVAENCDEDELYENWDTDDALVNPTINPYETECESKRAYMLMQISPGGVFYDDQSSASAFWADVLADNTLFNGDPNAAIAINGVDYDYYDFQSANSFVEEMAELMLKHHREYCHLGYCDDMEQTLLYENGLINVMQNATFVSSSVFTAPYNESFTEGGQSFSADPFLSQSWNGTNDLQTAIGDYHSHNGGSTPPNTYDDTYWPYTDGDDFTSTSGEDELRDFVWHTINSNAQDDDAQSPSQLQSDGYYELNAILMYKGIYSQIKQELIQEYKIAQGCDFQVDDNKVFLGPLTESEMEAEIQSNLSNMLNPNNCEALAIQNVANWISQIDPNCLAELESNNVYKPNYTESELINNSNPSNLEQILFNYTLATCPANTWGWFYDPGIGQPGYSEYEDFTDLMGNYANCSGLSFSFEVSNPGSTTYEITNQDFDDCFLELTAAMNDALDDLNAGLPSPTSANVTINSTNYPGISEACAMSGTLTATNTGGETVFSFVDNNTTCSFSGLELFLLSHVLTSVNSSDIDYLDNPTKHNDFIINGTSLGDIVTFDAHLFGGNIITVYFPHETTGDPLWGNSCIRLGDFGNMTLVDIDEQFPEIDQTDYVNDCVDAILGQATIDATNIYNEFLEGLLEEFALTMQSCIEDAEETFTLKYQINEYQYTLYYYDLASNLVQTVPPEGVDVLSPSAFDASTGEWDGTPPIHRMETRYRYNGLGTLISQFTPDGGTSNFVHDQLYRVRYSQNARQAGEDKASYTKYDELGRVEEAGEFYLSALTIAFLETKTEDNSYPEIGTDKVLDYTHTYYEEGYTPDLTNIEAQFESGSQEHLRNAIGAVYHRQGEYDGSGNVLREFESVISYSYDPHKNVKQSISTNYHLEGLNQHHKSVEYDYDLISGNVNEVMYQRGAEDAYRHSYHYDANNRLVRAFTSRDDGETWEMDAKYFYYLHGPLARVETGHDKIQGTDYAYNLLGWLKGVNSTTLYEDRDLGKDGSSGNNLYTGLDVFGFGLGYFGDGDVSTTSDKLDEDYISITGATPFANTAEATVNNISDHAQLYNGNISNMVTALRDLNEAPIDVLLNNYKYDQLQRIRTMDVYADSDLGDNNAFSTSTTALYNGGAYKTSYTFDGNGNLLTLNRNGSNGSALSMDEFTYTYDNGSGGAASESNRLDYVADASVNTGTYSNDLDGQSVNNYDYDASGHLIQDIDAEIDNIKWTVTGKVKAITFSSASSKNDIEFVYGPMDMRIAKIEYLNDDNTEIRYTYYTYDPSGNVMATYTRNQELIAKGEESEPHTFLDLLQLDEHMIYGSSRVGVQRQGYDLVEAIIEQENTYTPSLTSGLGVTWTMVTEESFDRSLRYMEVKYYEFSNHLGNVLEVASDRKIGFDNGTYTSQFGTKTSSSTDGIYDVYVANIVSYSDYYPYGMLMDGRHATAGSQYKYGFNGMEADDEVKGKGNSYSTEFRQYDSRLGRWLSLDPVTHHHFSPYSAFDNAPIYIADPSGADGEPEGGSPWILTTMMDANNSSEYEIPPGNVDITPAGGPLILPDGAVVTERFSGQGSTDQSHSSALSSGNLFYTDYYWDEKREKMNQAVRGSVQSFSLLDKDYVAVFNGDGYFVGYNYSTDMTENGTAKIDFVRIGIGKTKVYKSSYSWGGGDGNASKNAAAASMTVSKRTGGGRWLPSLIATGVTYGTVYTLSKIIYTYEWATVEYHASWQGISLSEMMSQAPVKIALGTDQDLMAFSGFVQGVPYSDWGAFLPNQTTGAAYVGALHAISTAFPAASFHFNLTDGRSGKQIDQNHMDPAFYNKVSSFEYRYLMSVQRNRSFFYRKSGSVWKLAY